MPFGNSLRVRFSIFSASCGRIRPKVRLATSDSKSMPSMMSKGSSTLPLDLDIFWPSASRTKPWTYTVLNGICGEPSGCLTKCMVIITIRATQKKMMSKPVTKTLVGWKVLSSGVCAGQPRVEKVHSPEENQVSSTSSSWRSGAMPISANSWLHSGSSMSGRIVQYFFCTSVIKPSPSKKSKYLKNTSR